MTHQTILFAYRPSVTSGKDVEEWLAEVRMEAARIAQLKGSVTSDDLRARFQTPKGASVNIWGMVFQDPRFEKAGIFYSERPDAHSRKTWRWKMRKIN